MHDLAVVARVDPDSVSAEVTEVADTFVGVVRTFNRARSRMLAAAAHDVEWSGHAVLKCLQTEGPMRAGSLADCLLSDPSTVSRQIAALVKEGLLERRADPEDGRASLLVLTSRAHEVLADHDQIRLRYFADLLVGWDTTDLRRFSDLLTRFTDDFNQMNQEWTRADLDTGSVRQGGTN